MRHGAATGKVLVRNPQFALLREDIDFITTPCTAVAEKSSHTQRRTCAELPRSVCDPILFLVYLSKNICQSTFMSRAHLHHGATNNAIDAFGTLLHRTPHPASAGQPHRAMQQSHQDDGRNDGRNDRNDGSGLDPTACHPAAWRDSDGGVDVVDCVGCGDGAAGAAQRGVMTRIDAASHTFYYNFLRKGTSPTKRGADLAQRSGNGIALIRIGLLDLRDRDRDRCTASGPSGVALASSPQPQPQSHAHVHGGDGDDDGDVGGDGDGAPTATLIAAPTPTPAPTMACWLPTGAMDDVREDYEYTDDTDHDDDATDDVPLDLDSGHEPKATSVVTTDTIGDLSRRRRALGLPRTGRGVDDATTTGSVGCKRRSNRNQPRRVLHDCHTAAHAATSTSVMLSLRSEPEWARERAERAHALRKPRPRRRPGAAMTAGAQRLLYVDVLANGSVNLDVILEWLTLSIKHTLHDWWAERLLLWHTCACASACASEAACRAIGHAYQYQAHVAHVVRDAHMNDSSSARRVNSGTKRTSHPCGDDADQRNTDSDDSNVRDREPTTNESETETEMGVDADGNRAHGHDLSAGTADFADPGDGDDNGEHDGERDGERQGETNEANKWHTQLVRCHMERRERRNRVAEIECEVSDNTTRAHMAQTTQHCN